MLSATWVMLEVARWPRCPLHRGPASVPRWRSQTLVDPDHLAPSPAKAGSGGTATTKRVDD